MVYIPSLWGRVTFCCFKNSFPKDNLDFTVAGIQSFHSHPNYYLRNYLQFNNSLNLTDSIHLLCILQSFFVAIRVNENVSIKSGSIVLIFL